MIEVHKTITPKKIAQKCPVCNTFGTVGYEKRVCHGCGGKGYVIVDQDGEIDRLNTHEIKNHKD